MRYDSTGPEGLFEPTHGIKAFVLPLSLLSLSRRTAQDLAAGGRYLSADRTLAACWRERLSQIAPTGRRVGICWAANQAKRTMPVRHLAPLLDLPRVTLFSLQIGAAGGDLAAWEGGTRVVNLAPEIRDFDDTAAIIAGLDAVVTVDTAVANLAGAMGATVHVLLNVDCDTRWGAWGPHTPWYPTATLWRDAPGGTREETVRRMVRALAVKG